MGQPGDSLPFVQVVAYLPGRLCFLMYNNKGLGGSHNGHVGSLFLPTSRQSCGLLLKTDAGLMFRSPLQLFSEHGKSGSGHSHSQGVTRRCRECCKGSPHQLFGGSPRVTLRGCPLLLPPKRNLLPVCPGLCRARPVSRSSSFAYRSPGSGW